MKYLHPKQVIYFHQQIIQISGGSAGVRDEGLLESAVYRPQATFGGHEFYPDLFSKVAAMGFSLIKNHAFVDANKRVGFEAMRLMLRFNKFDIKASEDKKFDFTMKIAERKMNEQAITTWLKEHVKNYGK